ncbi:MAG TPA: HAMP domain-containing sensor histidine kinase [Lachnospiraceae bacterium]|nr:HAMP domain-containing sensor histidine kinase [Lachnospiraceae bacterium]
MKRFNGILIGVICAFIVLLVAAGFVMQNQRLTVNREYLVEVNVIMNGMKEQKCFFVPDLHEMNQIKAVSFLAQEDREDAAKTEFFLRKINGMETHIEPLILDGKGNPLGLVRFDYMCVWNSFYYFWKVEGILAGCAFLTICLLIYVKRKLIKPFITLSNMPYELSRGHLSADIVENKSRFFGKFVWGISMLRDNLKSSRIKELGLEKEKKMLLLTISHDIKTPLNNIKLYAKALNEGIYDTEEKKREAARQIERLSKEIENFVKEIVKSSSEEVLPIEVENSEFYIKDFVEKIKEFYAPKCKLVLTDFKIEPYVNKLLHGSEDSAFEVVENIMENAYKYGDGRKIEISFYEEEYCQIMKIRNTGKPAKTEEIPHLFDSFFRGSNVGNKDGNGLGLYICREIMRKMDGDIFTKPEEDGMSFHLVFRC